MILKKFFLSFNNANMKFKEKELIWKIYSISKTLSTIKQVQLIDCKKFAGTVLDPNKEVFVVYLAYLRAKMLIHLTWKVYIALLLTKKVNIAYEYSFFVEFFSKESAVKLLKCSDIYKHTINFKPDKELL